MPRLHRNVFRVFARGDEERNKLMSEIVPGDWGPDASPQLGVAPLLLCPVPCTASVISEILSLENSLPFALYQELSDVRGARNDWLHELKPISREDGQHALHVAEEMLRLVDGIDLSLPGGLQLHW